jgi:DNA-directed RNA polymerase subunit RPC12/RpoP
MRRDRDRDFISLRVVLRGIVNRDPQCTRCGSRRVIPSRQLAPVLARLLGLTPYRCRACTRRFTLRLKARVFHALHAQAAAEGMPNPT